MGTPLKMKSILPSRTNPQWPSKNYVPPLLEMRTYLSPQLGLIQVKPVSPSTNAGTYRITTNPHLSNGGKHNLNLAPLEISFTTISVPDLYYPSIRISGTPAI